MRRINCYGGASPTGAATRHLSDLADLLTEAGGGEFDRAAALRFLLHTQAGRTLAARTSRHKRARQQKEQTTMKSRDQELTDMVKRHGIISVCKRIVEHEPFVSEHELTKMIGDAVERRPGESSAQAFSRAFSERSPDGVLMRKAIMATRDAQFVRMAG